MPRVAHNLPGHPITRKPAKVALERIGPGMIWFTAMASASCRLVIW